jgi:uncharacterized protein
MRTPLHEMGSQKWESLCDGCGRCCLRKILFDDSGELVYTRVACRYLDPFACRCTTYDDRNALNGECLVFSSETISESIHLLPDTCAYRLIFEGRDLPLWHPLVSGDSDSVHRAGVSVRGKVLSEEGISVEELEGHIIDWVRA